MVLNFMVSKQYHIVVERVHYLTDSVEGVMYYVIIWFNENRLC